MVQTGCKEQRTQCLFNIAAVANLIRENRKVTSSMIQETVNFSNIEGNNCVESCQDLLQMFDHDQNLKDTIITDYKTWFSSYNPNTRRKSS